MPGITKAGCSPKPQADAARGADSCTYMRPVFLNRKAPRIRRDRLHMRAHTESRLRKSFKARPNRKMRPHENLHAVPDRSPLSGNRARRTVAHAVGYSAYAYFRL